MKEALHKWCELRRESRLSIFNRQQKKANAQLDQVTAVRDRVWAMRMQMKGRQVEISDLFAMMGEDERKIYWDRGASELQANRQ
jgi:hypothetical protein